ncbi:MAG: hypothetical protein JWP02_1794, partial [Acidimicrobiales bacterium]|nr:hypothetical protein [Acidimicrobiales bacterium]
MSNEELAAAYSDGHITRRIFIRGLMAAGFTTGAAVAYAQFLSPTAYGQTPSSAGSGTSGGAGGSPHG